MTQDGPEAGAQIRPRPVRIVIIALLAAIALTLAYPMSARKSAPGQPQLSFSMRTVVRPVARADTPSDRQARVPHPADSEPKFEGYVPHPAAR